jgi:cytochrome c oxidase subunit 1
MTERGDATAAASYLTTSGPWWRVVWSWAATRDHKRIGVMYLCAILGAFLLGGVAAILIRTHHLTFLGPGQTTHGLFSPDNYNRTTAR